MPQRARSSTPRKRVKGQSPSPRSDEPETASTVKESKYSHTSSSSTRRQRNLNPLKHQHIHPNDLLNLSDYRYSGSDLSLLGNAILQPYWNFVVKLVPVTVAPNLITLLGFVVNLSGTALVMYYALVEAVQPPAWAWYYCAFSLFTYQTLDAIDGKQARRTGTGSPMGELFDHGCDAFCNPTVHVGICAALGLSPMRRFAVCGVTSIVLLLAIWEQFCLGTLDLGYINGPNEGILLGVAILFLTGLKGSEYWSQPLTGGAVQLIPATVRDAFDVPQCILDAFSVENVQDGLFLFLMVSCVFTVASNVLHVVNRRRNRPLSACVGVLMPTLVALGSYLAVVSKFPFLLSDHPFVVEMCFGLLCSYTATRLTVSRLCKTTFSTMNGYLLVSLIATTGSLLEAYLIPKFFSTSLLPHLHCVYYGLMFFAVWQYCHLIIAVFSQISDFLKINVLTMTDEQKRKSLAKNELRPEMVPGLNRIVSSFFSS
jgi:ethanolaminephosphotransferase